MTVYDRHGELKEEINLPGFVFHHFLSGEGGVGSQGVVPEIIHSQSQGVSSAQEPPVPTATFTRVQLVFPAQPTAHLYFSHLYPCWSLSRHVVKGTNGLTSPPGSCFTSGFHSDSPHIGMACSLLSRPSHPRWLRGLFPTVVVCVHSQITL